MCSIIGRLQTTEEHRRKEPLTTEFRCFANYPGSSNLVGRGTLYILPVYQPSSSSSSSSQFRESTSFARILVSSRETIVSQENLSLSLSFPLLSLPILPMPTWDYRSDHRARCDCTVLVFQRASFSPRGGLKRSEQEFARVPVCEKSIGPCNDLSSPSSFSHLLPNSRPDGAPGFSSYTLSNVQREREKGGRRLSENGLIHGNFARDDFFLPLGKT